MAVIFSSALVFASFFFLSAQTAHAQCPASGGPITVNHAVCKPAGAGVCSGSEGPGKDLCPCPVSGQQGGSITGICLTGCCKLLKASKAKPPKLPKPPKPKPKPPETSQQNQCEADQTAPGCPCQIDPESPTCPCKNDPRSIGCPVNPSVLDGLGSVLNTITNALGFDDLFGTDDSSGTTGTDGNTALDNAVENAPAQEDDTVATTYEYPEGDLTGQQTTTLVDENGNEITDTFDSELAGGGDFDADFDGARLDEGSDASTSGLSQRELEIAGLEELARRGASNEGSLQLSYESLTTAQFNSLRDYQSSKVAVSGEPYQGNPLSNERYDSSNNEPAATNADGQGFFSKVFALVASIFGFGTPVLE